MYKNIVFMSFIFMSMIISGCGKEKNTTLEWTSINVCDSHRQGDAHFISKNGKNVLVDGGQYVLAKTHLLRFLNKKGIKKLDLMILTHPHFDHYGGIIAILKDKNFQIGEIWMNMPTKEQMDKEWWGGKYKHLLELRTRAKNRHIPIKEMKRGDKFVFDDRTYMEVLYIYDGIHTPVGKTDINDMSSIIMIYDGQNKFLLTGDLNKKLGTYLAKNASDIKADILKVPHHGTEGLAPNLFFKKVEAKDFIVPAPKGLWESTRSKRTREYVHKNNINCYVNGIVGDVTILSDGYSYTISTQKDKRK